MKTASLLLFVILASRLIFCQSAAHSTVRTVRIQSVGCKSDGQLGPVDPPAVSSVMIDIPPAAAKRLAYYQARSGPGVLAPRDWFCFGTYGSSGETLYVSPAAIQSSDLFSSQWNGFPGPTIAISHEYGGTSGRFGVARVIARIFPAHRDFVEKVVEENAKSDAPAISFDYGPYKTDTLEYADANLVKFKTPANAEGLGTRLLLQKSEDAISGLVVLIGAEPDMVQVSARLPADKVDLKQFIIKQAEHEAVHLVDRGEATLPQQKKQIPHR